MGPRHGRHLSPVHGEHGTEVTSMGPMPIVGGALLGPDPLHPPSTRTGTIARTTNRIMCLSTHPDMLRLRQLHPLARRCHAYGETYTSRTWTKATGRPLRLAG